MKFFSKQSNYRITLRPGLPGNRQLGTPAISGVYVRFNGGIAEISRPMGGMSVEEIVNSLKSHPRFGDDFVAEDGGTNDPFISQRTEPEPAHVITEVKYGHADNRVASPSLSSVKFTPEQMEAVKKMATDMAIKLVEGLAKEAKKEAKEDQNIVKEEKKEKSIVDDYSKMAPEPLPATDGEIISEEVEPLESPIVLKTPITDGAETTESPEITETQEAPAVKRRGRPAKTSNA